MDNYLTSHYKGKYRVRAHYDKSTNDFVRDFEGNLDDSFGDFYLLGKSGIEIKHGVGSELACYVPKIGVGYNVLREYCKATTGKKIQDVDKVVEELKASGYINDCDILSKEIFFMFDAKHLDTLAPIIELRTSGASMSPFNTRNLPQAPYDIPEKDNKKYKKAIEGMSIFGIKEIQERFLIETFGEDVKSKMRLEMLKGKQYIHKHGHWDEYCKYIKDNK